MSSSLHGSGGDVRTVERRGSMVCVCVSVSGCANSGHPFLSPRFMVVSSCAGP